MQRYGPSVRLTDCAENPLEDGRAAAIERPCWVDEMAVDVFGADGRYLGEVELPDEIELQPMTISIDGDRVVARVQDESGTIMVKRYRLVLPGEEK